MRKFMSYLGSMFFSTILCSCSDIEINQLSKTNEQNEENNYGVLQTRSVSNDILTHHCQTDKLGIIMSCIVKNDSSYCLNLTIDDANKLGIPDSVYMIGIKTVNNLNKEIQK